MTTNFDVGDDTELGCDDNDDGDGVDMETRGRGRVVGGGGHVADGQRLHAAPRSRLARSRSVDQSPLQHLVDAGRLRDWSQPATDVEQAM